MAGDQHGDVAVGPVMSRAIECPVCGGKVSPLLYSRESPEAVLDRHIEQDHPDKVAQARKALRGKSKNDMLAELGSDEACNGAVTWIEGP